MFQKNSSTLLFDSKKLLLSLSILFLIVSCGIKPLSFSEKKIIIFFDFKKNPLNYSLINEIKKNFFVINASLAENKEEADYIIEIKNHRLGKFLEATDKNLFPAVVSLDYQVRLNILNTNSNLFNEIPIFISEDFSYDSDSILSNEKQANEIKLDFFDEVVYELLIFFSEQSNAESA